jgi:hypothetical protein
MVSSKRMLAASPMDDCLITTWGEVAKERNTGRVTSDVAASRNQFSSVSRGGEWPLTVTTVAAPHSQ